MKFAHPQVLWLLAVLMPALAWFLFWAWRKKQSLMSQFVQSRLLGRLLAGVSPQRQKARLILVGAAVACAIIAWARPQWGYGWEEAKQRGLDIFVAIDTSRSMLAEDVNPNRLGRAKLAALDLLRLARNDRLGLIPFAGSAFLQCPLTADEEAFRQGVGALEVGIIPQGGSALGEAITTALKSYKDAEDNHKILILISDGEDNDEGARAAAKLAAEENMRIFTIGIGSPDGDFIRQPGQTGQQSFLRDEEGNVIKSRLNEKLLQEIAGTTGGFYLNMRGINTIEMLYEKGLAPLPKTEITAKLVRRYHERFYVPLLISMLCLLIEMFMPDRPRTAIKPAGTEASAATVAVVLLLLFGVPVKVAAASPRAALNKYKSGDYAEAMKDYDLLLERKPDDARLHFNAGDAAYKAKNYDQAARSFNQALTAQDLNLQQRAFYNLGNTWYHLGTLSEEPEETMDAWEQAIKQYDGALRLNAQDKDAEHNRELVKKKLEELRKQQEQQEKQQEGGQPDQNQKQKQKGKKQKGKQKGNEGDSGQDSKAGGSKPEREKQGKKKSDEQKKEGGEDGKEKKDKEGGEKEKSGEKDDGKGEQGEGDQTEGESQIVLGQMSLQQAKQLLDAQKGEERALIFKPTDGGKPRTRSIKDW